MLIDTGATGRYVQPACPLYHLFPKRQYQEPRKIRFLDGTTATLVTEYVEAELDLGEGLKIATRLDVMAYEGPEVLVGLDFLKQFRARIDCGKGLIEFDGIGQDNGWKYPRLEEGLARGTALEKGEDEMSEEELRQVIPTQWHQERARRLPPRRECDHEIELTPGAELKPGPIYQLDEHGDAFLKQWINDGLASGPLRRSKSPYGSPVFLVL
ncbi:hypothetical protein TREMEDRAFT_64156 [Tremella mesenterica DSM 1558]|uniref:uncharacterized protein n=1 Tax=Tremella mesenterica (strain ATCC 24925 / CBS 8224 / DSM 1558 / NBRC 9311 / NRRL Y-6157 / RJB 2259-6 / UBC 559-6) TaxID=578456 RepID=UPI0003F4954B|nr:uncharacterized protein TREMEDRAFT_64156 [Tremella mesenterica DSM 1558]EIW67567.1 hypothetical protein TREMEDRAFT_64156 [Tremella mesenterica DSM 1558]